MTAKFENYGKFQKDAKKRILDDRPFQDNLIAPIALIFQPFGYFHDIRCGVEVPGEGDICEGELWGKVDALADTMTQFYKSEDERRYRFLENLEPIFSVSSGSIDSSKISSSRIILDGHVSGAHGAIVFCVECKDELSTASYEPTAQLVSCIATSFKGRVDHHPELFQRWRVPALGIIHVGEFTLCSSSTPPH